MTEVPIHQVLSRWNELPADCPVMVLFQQLQLLLSIGFTFTSA